MVERLFKRFPYGVIDWEIEVAHLDDGPYGWRAEVVAVVGCIEYAATRTGAIANVLCHLKQELRLNSGYYLRPNQRQIQYEAA